MTCPYCGKEMQKDILRANGNIRWMPQKGKEPLHYTRKACIQQGAILFPPCWDDKHLTAGKETPAFIC